MTSDDLTALTALTALDQEIAAVNAFDRARDVVVSLIEMRAGTDDVWEALGVVHERLEVIRRTYDDLEQLMIQRGWSMENPAELPQELRAAIEAQVPHHEQHLARTAEAEQIVGSWLGERAYERGAQRFWASQRATENHHLSRRRRRRGR